MACATASSAHVLASAVRGRYVELEYRQLSDHAFVEELLEGLFGERVAVDETLRRQRGKPKLEYLVNPGEAEPFVADSLSRGWAG